MTVDNILCVCTGNICRSPLAEGALRRAMPACQVSSGGIAAVEGGSLPADAAAIAEREGLELAAHRGRQLTAPMVRSADLILVMEKRQLEWIVSSFPEARGRVFMVTHWVGGEDIADPFRQSSAFFEQVYEQIEQGLKAWVERLRRDGAL